jgi:hypothetical protein
MHRQREYRVKKCAARILERAGFRVTLLPNDPLFDLEASNGDTIRKVRITYDDDPIPAIKSIKYPPHCKKEIWRRKGREFIQTVIP